jgi:hypothetical protein
VAYAEEQARLVEDAQQGRKSAASLNSSWRGSPVRAMSSMY